MSADQEETWGKAQRFWLKWVQEAFPDLDSRAYFLPPVHFNRVPTTRKLVAGQDIRILCEASGQAGQSTSGQSGQSTPGHAGQSTPGQSGQSTPGHAGQSTPGQSGQSTPGHAGQSTSGQSGQSGQSTPGPPAQSTGQSSRSSRRKKALSNKRSKAQPSVQDSDVRDDAAMQRVLFCLQKMSEKNREILVGLSQLQFGPHLGEPCYTAAIEQLPQSDNIPSPLPPNWTEGDFDVLLIHRHYGFVVCEVKSVGSNIKEVTMSEQDVDNNIKKKLKDAISQLDKAKAVLPHLASDIAPSLRITKSIALPNLTASRVQQAVSRDPELSQELCQCLETKDPADITGLCLCSDQLSDPKTPWDVSSDVLRELGNWWQRRVAVSGPDSHMTVTVYRALVARFCGPATTMTVPCTSPPRLCVKTLGQAVSWTGECYTAQITLFPEQVDLINTAPPRLFVAGPPGTGKTVVLLLMAKEWLRCGENVFILSTCTGSCAACSMLYHLLPQTKESHSASDVSCGQPSLLQFDFHEDKNIEKAVSVLSRAAREMSLYVVADEVINSNSRFKKFCDQLLIKVPDVHLWAASCYHKLSSDGWQEEHLTRPLRSPPAVVREVQKARAITAERSVLGYSQRVVPDHTHGPPVTRLYHQGQGHSHDWPGACVTCGREVASYLHSLRVGVEADVPTSAEATREHSRTTPPCLKWRDVFVLYWENIGDNSGVVNGLKEADIPVRVMGDDDTDDVATARTDVDVVWVADGQRVCGLERKVVVCLGISDLSVRLHIMSRCTSQLVIVS